MSTHNEVDVNFGPGQRGTTALTVKGKVRSTGPRPLLLEGYGFRAVDAFIKRTPDGSIEFQMVGTVTALRKAPTPKKSKK